MSRFEELLGDFFYRPDEDTAGLLELPEAPADSSPAPKEERPGEHLVFVLEGERYAVPIGKVREILRVPPLTEIPRAPSSLLGVMNLRGDVLPVYDLKMRLKLSGQPPRVAGPPSEVEPLPRAARVLVVHGPDGDAGVLVDAVSEVVKLAPSQVEPPPPGLSGERDCVVGLGRQEEQLFILIDLDEALG
ncbi:MAG: purine-binding chemotaxis protein CheW [Myxococcales bacterium]|nr:purine-binding chemotaxis protein CheW [Myxococcales bacterium]